MAGQRPFNPGVSLAGAVDLEALKHQVKAEPGQAGGAPAAGGYVIDTTENTFQAMVQTSATFPILLLLSPVRHGTPAGRCREPAERPDSAVSYRYRVEFVDRAGVPSAGRACIVRVDQRPSDADFAGLAVR